MNNGPFIVADLLRVAAEDMQALPARVAALHDAGRIVFLDQAMRVTMAGGDTVTMAPEDLLLFRGDAPYAVIHLR